MSDVAGYRWIEWGWSVASVLFIAYCFCVLQSKSRDNFRFAIGPDLCLPPQILDHCMSSLVKHHRPSFNRISDLAITTNLRLSGSVTVSVPIITHKRSHYRLMVSGGITSQTRVTRVYQLSQQSLRYGRPLRWV